MKVRSKLIQALLASSAPLSVANLSESTGLERKAVDRALGALVARDRASRERCGFVYVYFLTKDQAAMFDISPSPKRARAVKPPRPGTFGSGIGAASLSRRLRFLRELSDRPAFLGHAVLAEIVTDYQRALSRATDAEEARS